MKCERCHQRDATIHLSQTVQGKTVEQNLCETCARELGIDTNFDAVFNDLLGSSLLGGSVFNTTGGIPAFGKPAGRNLVCSRCGLSYDEFRKTGLFGCSHCYEAFADRLDPVFRRVQGGIRHVGRKLCETADQQEQLQLNHRLTDLRQKLQQAVRDEAYETAAHLRDEIRSLEQQLCTDPKGSDKPADHGQSPPAKRDPAPGKPDTRGGADQGDANQKQTPEGG